MALIHTDSFSFYDQNTIATNGGKFDNWNDEEVITIDGSYGRNGGAGLRLLTSTNLIDNRSYVTKHLSSNYDTIIVGAAVKVESESPSVSSELHFNRDKIIFGILDGTSVQACLCLTPSMKLRVRQRGLSGLELGRSDFSLHEGVYYYLEFKCFISSGSGTFTVRVDGVNRLTGSGNTQFTANQHGNGVRLGGQSDVADSIAPRYIKYDDFYIAAVVPGTEHNDFIGDMMIEGRSPTGDRPSNQWEASSGTIHYLTVDDSTPNTTDYIRAGTVGYVDTFSFSGASISSGSVVAVQPNIYARKTTAGVAAIVPTMTYQGTVTVADDENYLTQEYRYHDSNIWITRPNDDSIWDLNFTNSSHFGVKRSG